MRAEMEFFIDPARCIGCQACVHACSECETHKGHSMIHLEYIDRSESVQTVPVVCMHCESPTCADVCPADAIKRSGDGRVMTARKPRCIACSNCVLACPFGVPKMMTEFDLMMKCDMCYDRTSTGRKPMCATVCPSGALYYGTRAEVERPAETITAAQPVSVRPANHSHPGEHDGAPSKAPWSSWTLPRPCTSRRRAGPSR